MFSFNSFIDAVNEKKINMDAVMVIKDDVVLGLHRFSDDIYHNIFSVTKSYTSTAVGLAIDDGLLKLTDKPYDMFGDLLGADSDPRWQAVTLKNLLTMTSGHGKPHLMASERRMLRGETDVKPDPEVAAEWLRYAFTCPVVYAPGEKFSYGNLAPYVAGRMVEKVTGTTMQNYLYERFWQPTGVKMPKWMADNAGHSFAASDLFLDITDMAKLGKLYLNKGEYDGKRILSEAYVAEATKNHVASSSICPCCHANDEVQGYGFYFWHCSVPGSYRAYGREGQFVIVLPDRNAIICTQAMHSNVQEILDTVWEHLLPQI